MQPPLTLHFVLVREFRFWGEYWVVRQDAGGCQERPHRDIISQFRR
jgi:hypothetical protein